MATTNASPPDPPPTETQRIALCKLMSIAFCDIRNNSNNGPQSRALADAMHNLPLALHGGYPWSIAFQRDALQRFKSEYPDSLDYPKMFNEIFPLGS